MDHFVPAEVFSPGEYIRDEMDAIGWTQNDLAAILGRPVRLVNEIILGKRAITPETAYGLGEAFGTSAQYWMNHESAYQLSKVKSDKGIVADRAKLYSLAPIKDMARRNWIKSATETAEIRAELHRFFEAESDDQIEKWCPKAAARMTGTYSPCDSEESHWLPAFSVEQRAWLRQVERLASSSEVGSYSENLAPLLARLRALVSDPSGVRQVPDLLAEHGIRFVIVEHLPRTKFDGAALWLDGRPAIALSLRQDRLDNFWFNLFHELAHIANGDVREDHGFVIDSESDGSSRECDTIEAKANDFASERLFPRAEVEALVRRLGKYVSRAEVLRLAEQAKVHPAILVGQLQKREAIPYSQFRDLLVKVRDQVVPYSITDGWGQVAMN